MMGDAETAREAGSVAEAVMLTDYVAGALSVAAAEVEDSVADAETNSVTEPALGPLLLQNMRHTCTHAATVLSVAVVSIGAYVMFCGLGDVEYV